MEDLIYMTNLSSLTSLNIFLIWLSLLCLSLFLFTFFALKRAKKNSTHAKADDQERWLDLENKAQADYQEILETANKKAQEILSQSTQIKNESTQIFEKSVQAMLLNQKQALENTSLALSRKHLEEITELNKQSVLILTNVYKDIELAAKTDFEKYKELVTKQTFEAERIAQTRIKEEYIKLEAEMQQLKQQRIQELNENIYKILSKISKEVIGHSLSFAEHEDLVVKSLDEAKKEGAL